MKASTPDPLVALNPGKAGLWAAGTQPERSPAASRTRAQGTPLLCASCWAGAHQSKGRDGSGAIWRYPQVPASSGSSSVICSEHKPARAGSGAQGSSAQTTPRPEHGL